MGKKDIEKRHKDTENRYIWEGNMKAEQAGR